MSESHTAPATAAAQRLVRGSFLSAVAGWAGMMIALISFNVISYFRSPPVLREALWPDTAVFFVVYGVVAGVFVFVVWLVLLLQLYSLVPSDSMLWRWPVCTLCGALAGAAIMIIWGQITSPRGHVEAESILAAIAGGAACLFGSLTRRRFRD